MKIRINKDFFLFKSECFEFDGTADEFKQTIGFFELRESIKELIKSTQPK